MRPLSRPLSEPRKTLLTATDMSAMCGDDGVRIDACTGADMATVRQLFEEYAAFLNVDLCFQNFAEELATLPGAYAPPAGGLWLARVGTETAGCVGLRPLSPGDCEMKRLWVRHNFRGRGIGRALAQATVEHAREQNYARVLLDTLARLPGVRSLYTSLGFQRTEPYNPNPFPDVEYYELPLRR